MNLVRREFRLIVAALSFFTRLPVPGAAAVTQDDLRAAPRYFPLIGAWVGAIGAGVWWAAHRVLPSDLAILLSMAATVLLTGAFHEDGFTDVCDGFGGGFDRARVLAIMKDSRVGAFGVIGIVLLLALKASALMHVPPVRLVGVLVAAHAASRWAAVLVIAAHPYVREDENAKGKVMAGQVGVGALVVATAIMLATMLLLPWRFWWTVAGVVVAQFLLGRWFKRRIGGYTGDCLGATQQVCEVVFYLLVVALA